MWLASSGSWTRRGDDFFQADLRISKDFLFGDRMGVEVLAEMFNITNAKNGAIPDSTGQPTTYAGDPGQGEQRLIQLGARFHF